MKQGSDQWLAERLLGVTSTDIVAILGVSPWKSEGDIARDKQGQEPEPPDAETARRFRLGHALESVVRDEDIFEHGISLRRVNRLFIHHLDPLLRTSLDFERVGERTIVEVKTSTSRDWDDGLPDYVEAQVRWQMGVANYPRAHVAALRYGARLQCYDVEHDPDVFAGMATIAHDFWTRLQAGGPFDESRDSIKRAWPLDDGTEMAPDADLVEAVDALRSTRRDLDLLSELESKLVAAIQTRMGPAALIRGPGWKLSWRRGKDRREADYKGLSQAALGYLDPITIEVLSDRYTTTRPGTRPFVLKDDKETEGS